MKYLILGALFGLLAAYGSWAIFNFVWSIDPALDATASTVTMQMSNAVGLVVIFAILTWLVGLGLDKMFPSK